MRPFLIIALSYFSFLVAVTNGEQVLHENQVHVTTKRHSQIGTAKRSTSRADKDIETLQTWLDSYVASNNRLVGVSAFIVAGQSPVETVSSGKAVIARAWDATNKKEVTNEEKPVSADTTCMLASVSKLFTWTALSMLLDAGKFELDDPIDNVLSFQIRNPSFQNNPITYRHVYSHTSGIEGEWIFKKKFLEVIIPN